MTQTEIKAVMDDDCPVVGFIACVFMVVVAVFSKIPTTIMGCFSNGMAVEVYCDNYCNHCIHNTSEDPEEMCAVLAAHTMTDLDEHRNPESILHILIPRDDGVNLQCAMFVSIKEGGAGEPRNSIARPIRPD